MSCYLWLFILRLFIYPSSGSCGLQSWDRKIRGPPFVQHSHVLFAHAHNRRSFWPGQRKMGKIGVMLFACRDRCLWWWFELLLKRREREEISFCDSVPTAVDVSHFHTELSAGISRDSWHKRRATGGKRKPIRKKRKFELGRPAANTKVC